MELVNHSVLSLSIGGEIRNDELSFFDIQIVRAVEKTRSGSPEVNYDNLDKVVGYLNSKLI